MYLSFFHFGQNTQTFKINIIMYLLKSANNDQTARINLNSELAESVVATKLGYGIAAHTLLNIHFANTFI
jgi:hypothetical protein